MGWQQDHAQQWAETVVHGLGTRFPWASAHVSLDEDDCDVTPWRLHPAFHGCLDWHSSVHMLASAVILFDEAGDQLDAATSAALVAELDERLTSDNARVERDYLRLHPRFERPYGWGWAAFLAARARQSSHPHAPQWAAASEVVAQACFENLLDWLPKLSYPVRTGVHDNTAFGLVLLLDAAGVLGRVDVVDAIRARAMDFYADDRQAPVTWEPSGNDFLSPSLCEAQLMQRVLDQPDEWLATFLPGLGDRDDPLLTVPRVLDRTDGKAVHLFGLALSRAWQLQELATALPADRAARAVAAARRQVQAVEQEIVRGDFMSTHWLVSFAIAAHRVQIP